MKKCGRCQTIKENEEFSASQLKRSGSICRNCCTEKARDYKERNRDKIRAYEKEYRPKYLEKHAEEKATYQKDYYEANKKQSIISSKNYRESNRDKCLVYAKQYYQDNKEELKAQARKYRQEHKEERRVLQNEARKNDPMQKIHHNVSNLIRLTIKRNGSSKSNNSIIDHLEYTIEQLKVYLESLFEPWMSWENWGKYDSQNWNDNDPSTWTWQLDHIIPQSTLSYISMTDDNFQKCWRLSNLRPYSAKLNSIDGANRIRHVNS